MRKVIAALAATALVTAPTAAASAAGSAAGSAPDESRAVLGAFSPAFREDGFRHGAETSCYVDGDHRTCLPSGASQNVLPDGRVLYWNAIEGSEDVAGPAGLEGHRRAGDSRSRLLTLGPKRDTWATPANETGFFGKTPEKPLVEGTKVEQAGDTPNDGSLFCADNTFLPNGDVLTVGGTDYYAEPGIHPKGHPSVGLLELEGLKSARSFTAEGDTWQAEKPMTYGRWYPSLTTLADGRVLASSGVTKLLKPAYAPDERYGLDDSGRNVVQSEVFDPETRTWSLNPPSADRSLPLYPRMHLLPNGHVYYDAAGQAFNPAGQGYDEALWNQAAAYDPDFDPDRDPDRVPKKSAWTEFGIPGLTTGGDKMADFGFRGSTFSQMLNLKAPYRSASFLSAGGVVGTTPGSYAPVASARINRWSQTDDGEQTLDTHDAGSLAAPRWYGSGVTLPDGSVIVLSGADLDHVIAPGTEAPITRVERFVPTADGTDGTWSTLAEAARGRTYHNAATLLPDGRVLVGGHDPIPTLYGPQNDDLARSEEEPDASFEIFSPPYLFDADGRAAQRPVIREVGPVAHGRPLDIGVAGDVDRVVLVRNPSVTHLVDGDQRNVELRFSRTSGGVEALVPDNPAVVPPGPYLLFVLTSSGTPSVAEQVFVPSPVAGAAAAATVTAADAPDADEPHARGGRPRRPFADTPAGGRDRAVVAVPAAGAVPTAAAPVAPGPAAGPVVRAALAAHRRETPFRTVPAIVALVALAALCIPLRRALARERVTRR